MAPWAHLHVLTTGDIFPCCMSAHEPGNAVGSLRRGDTLEAAWNSHKMRALRARMLRGEASELCERCYRNEAVGRTSWRQSENRNLAHHFDLVGETSADGRLVRLHLPYLDVRFSNLCNLKCRICTPELSSRWHGDAVALGLAAKDDPALITAHEDPERLWSQLEPLLSTVERFHFAGGEPLVMEEHYRVLQALLQRDRFDVRLSYNTNFSTLRYKGKDVLELWKPFRHVYVQASLDGMGARADYMRKGQRWEQVMRDRERMLKECPHVQFCLLPTVSIMNVLHLPDFYRDWLERGFIGPADVLLNILFEPEHLSVQGLPPSFKERVLARYREFIDSYLAEKGETAKHARGEFEAVLRYMLAEDRDVAAGFRGYTVDLDVLRNERFEEVFPELAELVAPTPALAWIERGRSRRRFGMVEPAIRDFDRAIAVLARPGEDESAAAGGGEEGARAFALALFDRADLKRELGDPDGALRDLEAAIQSDRELIPAYVERARLRRELGDSDGAAADLARASGLVGPFQAADARDARLPAAVEELPAEPDSRGAAREASDHARRAASKRQEGDVSGAVAELVAGVRAVPAAAVAHLDKLIAGSRDGRVRLLPEAGSEGSDDIFSALALAYFLRGVARQQRGDRPGAISDFTAAASLPPGLSFAQDAGRLVAGG